MLYLPFFPVKDTFSIGMQYYVAVSVLIAIIAVVLMVRFLTSFFVRLEEQKSQGPGEYSFETPTSTQRLIAPSILEGRATKSLSVVIPAYNEELRLPSTLEETLAYLQQRRDRSGPHFTYEVIIVDDGSTDDTTKVAFDFVRKHGVDAVRVLSLPINKGKGQAVKAGVMCTRGEQVLFMDADGATSISEVEKLESRLLALLADPVEKDDQQPAPSPSSWERVASSPATFAGDGRPRESVRHKLLSADRPAFVLGSRAHLQNAALAKRTAVRNFLMHGFHSLVTLVVGNTIRDTQCGFKLMTRRAAQMIFPNQRLQRWAFDVELVHLAQSLNVPMAEVQVVWTEIAGSKVRLTSIMHIAFELAMIKIGYGCGSWQIDSIIREKKE